MNLTSQKKIAAKLMKVGETRVQFNPDRIDEVSDALTREDVRYLISSGAITSRQVRGVSRGRARDKDERKSKGRSKGQGNRSGKKYARESRKAKWVSKIRAIRDELCKLRDDGKLDKTLYRKLYRQANGNYFQSRRHLREHIERITKK
ncbi:MAG: 50S ribosomal protein L19e [Candidatus Altiarchaeota archaeon]